MVPQTEIHNLETIFYDGNCGLCHRTVRFVLAHDPNGLYFNFAPLQGETFSSRFPEKASFPDSVVVEARGSLLTRSDAVTHIMERLGGALRVAGRFLRLVPRPLRDLVYMAIARMRGVFSRPAGLCPLVPEEQRHRFLS